MKEQPTIVQFRVFPDGDVIAIFPGVEYSRADHHCLSYMHVGQHAACDAQGVIRSTKPATLEQSAPLRRELESRGYVLRVVRRIARQRYWWNQRGPR